jgi:putative redox protein
MKSSITATWKDKMAFEVEVAGHKIMIDADEKVGGENKGPQPKPFMLVALGGCTAMDVISILRKMRVELDDFKVRVEGDITEEHPKHFYKMKVIYEFTGKNLPMDKLKKAVNLSEERYCGVSASYRKAMELSSEIIVHES